jgi:hypothetical protein
VTCIRGLLAASRAALTPGTLCATDLQTICTPRSTGAGGSPSTQHCQARGYVPTPEEVHEKQPRSADKSAARAQLTKPPRALSGLGVEPAQHRHR